MSVKLITMGLAKGSKKTIIILSSAVLLCLIITILVWFRTREVWHYSFLAIITSSYFFVIWTFRDPKREIIQNPKKILAPADGTITELIETEDGISCVIRMSPIDVHMNRSPIDGEVKTILFKKGKHWPVYFPKYAKKNQRNTIEIFNENQECRMILTQVSGIFARRTISYIKEGDKILQGQVIGTIIFGSITSLRIISAKKYKVVRPIPKSVRAGITVLAIQGNDSD